MLGITYGANDRLFIYNTGHGEHENKAAPPVMAANRLHFDVQLAGNFDTTIDLLNVPSSLETPDLVAAFLFRGGDQEFMAVVETVAEPGTPALIMVAALAGWRVVTRRSVSSGVSAAANERA